MIRTAASALTVSAIGKEVGILSTFPFRGVLSDIQPRPFRNVRLFLGGEVYDVPRDTVVLVAL